MPVKLSLIYGETPEMGNAFQLYIHDFTDSGYWVYFLCKKGGDTMSVTVDGKEYYGVIYKIENVINNKVYIGQTTQKRGFEDRYCRKGEGIERVYSSYLHNKDNNRYYNVHLLRSIEKYGFNAFVVDEVFDVALSPEELNQKEMLYIKQFDSFYNGYNSTLGGEGMSGYQPPTGKNHKQSVCVCQIDPSGELIKVWDSFGDIHRELGIRKGAIANVCSGRKETSGGFVWVYEKDYNPNNDYSRTPKTRGGGARTNKPILLLDSNNKIIQEFISAVEVSATLGTSKQEVSRICKHQRKKPKYNLVFKSEYIEEQRLNVRELCEAS